MLDRKALKWEAKAINHDAHVSVYRFTALYLAIVLVMNAVNRYMQGDPFASMRVLYPEFTFPAVPAFLDHEFPYMIVLFVSIITTLLSCVLDSGYYLYLLGVRRRQEMGYDTLFDGFSFAGKLILLKVGMSLLIFFWTLLFIVPGFIARYRYRFAIYNLCENPEMGVHEALQMSIAQTDGFKGQLFVLDLTFLGWNLLSLLTMGLLDIYVAPYRVQTDLGFFREIKGIKQIGYRPPEEDPTHTDGDTPLF